MKRIEKNETGPTIFDACRTGDTARVDAYIAGKGCVSEPDDNKMTMLHHASFGGNIAIVQRLLGTQPEQKVDLDAADVGGWCPLHYAADKGHLDIVALLLEDGANVNAKDEMKKTPLHLAAAQGHVDIARELLKNGASKNAKSISSWDALRYAQEHSHDEMVALLSGTS